MFGGGNFGSNTPTFGKFLFSGLIVNFKFWMGELME